MQGKEEMPHEAPAPNAMRELLQQWQYESSSPEAALSSSGEALAHQTLTELQALLREPLADPRFRFHPCRYSL